MTKSAPAAAANVAVVAEHRRAPWKLPSVHRTISRLATDWLWNVSAVRQRCVERLVLSEADIPHVPEMHSIMAEAGRQPPLPASTDAVSTAADKAAVAVLRLARW